MNDFGNEFAWSALAACRSSSAAEFFPSNRRGVEAAQAVCHGCPVREECLDYALVNRLDHGVWGGTSERERHDIVLRLFIKPRRQLRERA